MKLAEADSSHVIIGSPAAELKITRIDRPHATGFTVEWSIRHGDRGSSSGIRIFYSTTELAGLFGFTYNGGQGLIDQLGDGALHLNSMFIRSGRFLNVPCQGTSMDGDPNISIFITDEIQKAIRDLLEAATKRMSTK